MSAARRPLPARALRLSTIRAQLEALASTTGALRLGAPDLNEFPMRIWRRLTRDRIATLDSGLDYGKPAGLPELRAAISRHVAQFRGVAAEAEQIMIVDGAQSAFHLISLVLAVPGDAIAIEDPCYALARAAFEAQGLTLRTVPVDDDGLRPEALPAEAALAYVTPCHQFPLGGAMTLTRRMALLEWARRVNAYVIEDDYDSEFDTHPLPALQSLDRDERVIYVGTFSKTLAPGLRLAYIVVPPHLAETMQLACMISNVGTATYLQGVVADFIAGGHFVRHVRRMVATYQRRRNILVETLDGKLPPSLRIGPAQTGLHIAITGPPDFDDVRIANSLGKGLRVYPLSLLCVERTDCRGLVVGCSAGDDEAIRAAALDLVAALR